MIKNLPEFKALIIRYETITIEEIEKNFIKSKLTGFGSVETCTLCIAVVVDCRKCIYGIESGLENIPCCDGRNQLTYDLILHAETPAKLLTAYRNRAKHMRSILKKLNLE